MPKKVREVIKRLEDEGYVLARTRGSHRQYRSPDGARIVTVPGKASDTLKAGTLASIRRATRPGGPAMTEYLAIYEHDTDGWSVYVPDLPGCVSTGETREDAETGIRESVVLHLDGLRAEGLPVPPPSTVAGVVAA